LIVIIRQLSVYVDIFIEYLAIQTPGYAL